MQIEISIAEQTLTVTDGHDEPLAQYPVSTALNGAGEEKDSFCTPRGQHIVRAKIGADASINSVFVGRRPTGEIWTPELSKEHPDRDWILTRILWLSGCEIGINRLGNVDSMQRYIYIHGTPDTEPMGEPHSHGCIRMRNSDVIALFDLVPVGTKVFILEGLVTDFDDA
ncbi:MAG TPA: L,D-transpeptidase [Methylophilaceae bacterium]|nr:L,D-transpeptidase [Methylophilaceae bacterium]